MTLKRLLELMATNEPQKVISLLETQYLVSTVTTALAQFNPKTHDVTDTAKRPDKPIKDENGNNIAPKKVSRITIPLQQTIVDVAAAFLGAPTIECTTESKQEEDLLEVLQSIWDDNKLDYKCRRQATHTMSETHSAEIWYTRDAEPGHWDGVPFEPAGNVKFVMKILAPSLGDNLYPVFDEFGDMIAFGRSYKIKEEDGKEIVYFDLYTAEVIYLMKQEGNTWLFSTDGGKTYSIEKASVKNMFGKIPIVYYSQPVTEWEHVQPLIDRLEKKISDLADTNDYFASPIVVATARVVSMPDKGEQGKLIEIEGVGDVKYLTWDQSPESTKLEIELLEKFIYTHTSTPDISFQNLKNLGYFSTNALKTMFMQAHLKAAKHEEVYGECMQRRINYLKKAITVVDPRYKAVLRLKIKPKFTYFLPENIDEQVNTLIAAVNAKILSQETAVRKNPQVDDPEAEIKAIKKEAEEAQAAAVVLPAPIQNGNGVPVK